MSEHTQSGRSRNAEAVVSLEEVASKLDTREAYVLTMVDGIGLSIGFVAATIGKTEAKTLKILARARRQLGEVHGETNG